MSPAQDAGTGGPQLAPQPSPEDLGLSVESVALKRGERPGVLDIIGSTEKDDDRVSYKVLFPGAPGRISPPTLYGDFEDRSADRQAALDRLLGFLKSLHGTR